MSLPAVNINELDGALGILPSSAGRLFAVVGVSDSGPVDTPATYARARLLEQDFGKGPMVEAAAHYIEKYGRPVVVVRTGQSVAGVFPATTTVVFTGTGTSVITVDDVTADPTDDLDFVFEVLKGGTIGTAGITFRWSIDGGNNWSAETALGTATSFTFPEGGAVIDFAAGTLVAGDRASFRGQAPNWNGTELGTALDALFASQVNWDICHVVGPVDATAFDVIDPKFSGAMANGKYRSWYGNTRMPASGESEATYLSSLSTEFAAKATVHGSLCAGHCELVSSVTGRKQRRPISYVVAAREQSVDEHVNIAAINEGALPGVSLYDSNGNNVAHDEALNPGLDDARFATLRTWEGYAGIYVTRPRIFSTAGSDFDVHTKRRVINLAHAALRSYFTRRLSVEVLVDATTGFILEEEALEMESGARGALKAVLAPKKKASGWTVAISRTDNLLSTKTLTGSARVVPLAYPEAIEIDLGFLNPALQTQTV